MAADASADGARGDTRLTEGELTPREVGGFRILRRLASGRTSDVLLARAEGPHGFQRMVALKILLARKQADTRTSSGPSRRERPRTRASRTRRS